MQNLYKSPIGDILLAADEVGLTGLWFYGQKYFAQNLDEHEKNVAQSLLMEEKINAGVSEQKKGESKFLINVENQSLLCEQTLSEEIVQNNEILAQARRWLDIYFSGKIPEFSVPLHMVGTDFQITVWKILCSIPYGKTMTYGEIAKQIESQQEGRHTSARAVGGAVGHNPISIIVPCHRVVGGSGSLTGYAGGLDKKTALLKLEGNGSKVK